MLTPEKFVSNQLREYKTEADLTINDIVRSANALDLVHRDVGQKLICQEFINARKVLKISQERLAEEFVIKSNGTLYFSQPKVSQIERRSIMTAVEFLAYWKYFQCDINVLLDKIITKSGLAVRDQFNQAKVTNYLSDGKMKAFDFLVFLQIFGGSINDFQDAILLNV